MNRKVREVTEEDVRVVCDFCHRSTVNSLEWGPMYQLDGVTVHYFCMLFSAGLSQNGEDEEGIFGFLPDDIRKEIKRGAKLKCRFCRKPNATIGCCITACKTSYHYPCGLQKESSFQFLGNYSSYCVKHKEEPELPPEGWIQQRDCPICFLEFEKSEPTIWPPCCKKRAHFHKRCLMEAAKTHGVHFFKCPLCYDKGVFLEAMQMAGIYIPDMDAAWESEPNAFGEHRQLYSQCDAANCLCPKGRDYADKKESKPWKIIRCGACGASAIHKYCGKLVNLTWRCETCADILTGKRKSAAGNSPRIQRDPCATSSTTNHAQVAKSSVVEKVQVRDVQVEVESSTESPCSANGSNKTSPPPESEDAAADEDQDDDTVFISPKSIVYQQLLNGASKENIGVPPPVRRRKLEAKRPNPIPVPIIRTSPGKSPVIPVTPSPPDSSSAVSDTSREVNDVQLNTDKSPPDNFPEFHSPNEVVSPVPEVESERLVILECRSLTLDPIHESQSEESEENNTKTGEGDRQENIPNSDPELPGSEDQLNSKDQGSSASDMPLVTDEQPEALQWPEEDVIIDVEDYDSDIEIVGETAPAPPPTPTPTLPSEDAQILSRLQDYNRENGLNVTPLEISEEGLTPQQKDYVAFAKMFLKPEEPKGLVQNQSPENEGSADVKRQDSVDQDICIIILDSDEEDEQDMACERGNGISTQIAKNEDRVRKRKCEEIEG